MTFFCQEDIPESEGVEGDISMKNVPICIASSCPNDTTMRELMRSAVDMFKSIPDFDMSDVPKAVTGEKCNSESGRLMELQ
jgi:hypothetical protein